jgi:hypothetical protein
VGLVNSTHGLLSWLFYVHETQNLCYALWKARYFFHNVLFKPSGGAYAECWSGC